MVRSLYSVEKSNVVYFYLRDSYYEFPCMRQKYLGGAKLKDVAELGKPKHIFSVMGFFAHFTMAAAVEKEEPSEELLEALFYGIPFGLGFTAIHSKLHGLDLEPLLTKQSQTAFSQTVATHKLQECVAIGIPLKKPEPFKPLKIEGDGRILLPKWFRRLAGWKAGDELDFDFQWSDGNWVIELKKRGEGSSTIISKELGDLSTSILVTFARHLVKSSPITPEDLKNAIDQNIGVLELMGPCWEALQHAFYPWTIK